MEQDNLIDELWPSILGPLFEENEPEEEEVEMEESVSPLAFLEDRLNTAEYRLTRASMNINRCLKEIGTLQKQCEKLEKEQGTYRARQVRHQKVTTLGIYGTVGLLLLGQIHSVARLGWRILKGAAELLNVSPNLIAGVLLSVVALGLMVWVGRGLLRILFRWLERREEDAVCDR